MLLSLSPLVFWYASIATATATPEFSWALRPSLSPPSPRFVRDRAPSPSLSSRRCFFYAPIAIIAIASRVLTRAPSPSLSPRLCALNTGSCVRSIPGLHEGGDGHHLLQHAGRPVHTDEDRHPLPGYQHQRPHLLGDPPHFRQVRFLSRNGEEFGERIRARPR